MGIAYSEYLYAIFLEQHLLWVPLGFLKLAPAMLGCKSVARARRRSLPAHRRASSCDAESKVRGKVCRRSSPSSLPS